MRIPESSQISYEVMPNAKRGEYVTRDISQGGLRFLIHEFIPEKSLLKIRLTLKKRTFSFEAVVKFVWIRRESHNDRYEIGVEFIDLPEQAAKHLIEYIKSASAGI